MKTPFKTILKSVTGFLDANLPEYLTYHNTEHTLYVLEKAVHIAEKETIKKEDLLLVKIAALYHDIGFTESHKDHEVLGCRIASKQLKDFGFTEKEIDKICGMIMATKIPQQPKTHLEKIVADADLEYLATSRYSEISNYLFEELKYFNPNLSKSDWKSIQIEFIKNHQYHTKFCKHYKSHRKLKNLNKL